MDLQSSGCAQTTVGPAGGQGQCSRQPQQSCQRRERARYKRGGARWLDPRMLQTATHPALNIPPGWKHCMVTTWIQLQVSNIGQPTWVKALYGINYNGYKSVAWNIPPGWKHYISICRYSKVIFWIGQKDNRVVFPNRSSCSDSNDTNNIVLS